MTLAAGTRLGPYEVVALLGAGGMGEVYRARDTRLGREVAIKVLPPGPASDPDRLRRFEREARSASALNHPNIVTIYDVGSADSTSFIVMELVKGESLRATLSAGALPIRRLLQIGSQMAEGLSKAHAAGIVHRDLKPENVMVTEECLVKILDFGLAKLAQPEAGDPSAAPTVSGATEEGVILGTVGYMSPEQAVGGPLDHRSDQFSLGSILYEMATGRRAFQRASAPQTLIAILQDEPEPVIALNPKVPERLCRIVERCLAKKSSDRYGSTADLARDLATLREYISEAARGGEVQATADVPTAVFPAPEAPTTRPASPAEVPERRRTRGRRLRVGAALAAAIIVVAVGMWVASGKREKTATAAPEKPPPAEPTSIAVLPFVDMSAGADQEYFSDGLSEELLNVLAQAPGLRVISRTSSFQFKGKNEDVRTIGRRLDVAHVLEGSVRKSGRRIRITAQLVDAATGSHLWSETYDRELDDIFAVQDDIARSVANACRVTLLGLEGQTAASPGRSVDAYNLYLQAEHAAARGTREGLEQAVGDYERALKLDPGRAIYWARLAAVRSRQASQGFVPPEEGFEKAREEVGKALTLDPRMAEAYDTQGYIRLTHDWNWKGADESYREALRYGPGSAKVLGGAASLAGALGRFGEAVGLYRRAIAIDPLNVVHYFNLGIDASYAGRLDEADAALRKVVEINPELPGAHAALGRIDILRRKPEAALEEMEREKHDAWRLYGLALAYHALGRKDEADSALAELVREYGEEAAFQVAEIYGSRGDKDEAMQWLERAFAQKDAGLAFLKGDPLFESLEGDPRYRAFLQKMRLPA